MALWQLCRATRAAAARAHLTELLPALLSTIAEAGNPDDALRRFDDFLSRLPSGVQLFSLLRNHENLRTLLVALMASAPRMADAVIHRAHVMDGLIDPAFADDVRRREVLLGKIEAFFAEARDYQEVIDRARIIGQEQMFLIAAGCWPARSMRRGPGSSSRRWPRRCSTKLFDAVRREFERRHGVVPGARVGLLAFGKMASREMTARSDLDFIMLYDLAGRRRVERRKASAGEPVLRPPHPAPARRGERPDLGRRALRGRYAAAGPPAMPGRWRRAFRASHSITDKSAWTWEHLAAEPGAHGLCRRRPERRCRGRHCRNRWPGRATCGKTIDDVVAMRA